MLVLWQERHVDGGLEPVSPCAQLPRRVLDW